MMRHARVRALIVLAAVTALALGPTDRARAVPTLQLTMLPGHACPGDKVRLEASLGNLGGAAQTAMLVAMVRIGRFTYGPFTIERRMRSNEILREVEAIHVPHDAPAGPVVLAVSGRIAGRAVRDSTQLVICSGKTRGEPNTSKLVNRIREAFRDLRH